MSGRGNTAEEVGGAISSLADAVTRRLADLALGEMGPPPVPFLWVACGSQARGEQSSHSDQDSAMIVDDGLQPADGE